jgi:hypothetical protein
MAQAGTEALGNYGRRVEVVWKEMCDRQAETFEDAEKSGERVAI